MMKLFKFLPLLLLISIVACEPEVNPPIIIVTPSDIHIFAEANGVVEFEIDLAAGDANLSRFMVRAKPVNGVTTTLVDSLVAGSGSEFFYIYDVPTGVDEVLLTFTVIDADGESNATLRNVFIVGNALLEQTTGHLMYSPFNVNSLNAFDIDETEPLTIATVADTSVIDIVEFDLEDNDELARSITSYSGTKFVRNNDFNYAEATTQSAMGSFESSNAQSVISNVMENDIIITKYDTVNNRYAVIRMVNITDAAGIDGDVYEFNLKK